MTLSNTCFLIRGALWSVMLRSWPSIEENRWRFWRWSSVFPTWWKTGKTIFTPNFDRAERHSSSLLSVMAMFHCRDLLYCLQIRLLLRTEVASNESSEHLSRRTLGQSRHRRLLHSPHGSTRHATLSERIEKDGGESVGWGAGRRYKHPVAQSDTNLCPPPLHPYKRNVWNWVELVFTFSLNVGFSWEFEKLAVSPSLPRSNSPSYWSWISQRM